MLVELVVCALAAAGIVLVIWVIGAALLLPAREDCVLLEARGDAEDLQQRVRSYRFLCDSGLMRTRILVVDCGLSQLGRERAQRLAEDETIELCGEQAVPEVWKTEREH